jgi:AcrR family transcriptional regulator
MGINERKNREHKQMEKIILDAAMKLFLAKGYKNVTIRGIAKEIEYSPATIYLYYKDKDDIFWALQRRAFGKFIKAQLSVQSIKNPLDRLKAHGKVYIDFAAENSQYYDLMFIFEIPNCPPPKDEQEENLSYDILRRNVKECIDAGLISAKDVEVVSFAMWAYVHGICSLMIKRGNFLPPQHVEYLKKGSLEMLDIFFKKK